MSSYIGITIGPIIGTMALTSTPAGLWAASYLFSELSKQICKKLREKNCAIISPYFEDITLGVGLFPDRIILEQGNATPEGLQPLFDAAIVEVAGLLSMNKANKAALEDYLRDYIQVHAIAFETNENPIEYSKNFLAAAELERRFASSIAEDRLLSQFEWRDKQEEESKSSHIKGSKLVKDLEARGLWPLSDEKYAHRIRDLADISSNGLATYDSTKEEYSFKKTPWKKHRYYAVIQADGDNVGTRISALPTNKKIEEFSTACWEYSRRAEEIVRNFGGVPIYVGGDDLLALVPVENADKQNLFTLLSDLRSAFNCKFKNFPAGEEEEPLALSFGVAIQYYKFPLYESLTQARKLLFEQAKEVKIGDKKVKNSIALRLQKHSGQSVELVFSGGQSELLTKLAAQIDALPKTKEESDKTSLLLHAIMTHLRTQKQVFATALEQDALTNAFKNVLRDSYAKQPETIKAAQALLELCKDCEKPLDMTDQLLRLVKFFVEEGDDRA